MSHHLYSYIPVGKKRAWEKLFFYKREESLLGC